MSAQVMAPQTTALSRREFLYYVWLASMAMFMGHAGGALLWFAVPRFRPGEFGGVFTLDASKVPPPGAPPQPFDGGRFWLVNVDAAAAADPRHPTGYETRSGVLALYKVCVHLGCLYQWKPVNDRFECPCHGSKFLKDGVRIHRPASRDLDRFVLRALDADGNVLAETGSGATAPEAGQPLLLPSGTTMLQVDTSRRIQGRTNDGPNQVE